MKKLNIVIIQARIDSKRLPKKMFKKIGNYYLIEWVVERVKMAKSVDKIILATTTKNIDKRFKTICQKFNIDFFEGEENDVLSRFISSVKKINNPNIIRVCADNPFIDPDQIDLLISIYTKYKYDYVCNHQNKINSRYADGFGAEIFSLDLLKKINNLAVDRKHREHITLFIWKNRSKFKIHSIKADKNLAYPKLKFDIDTLEDYERINRFVKKFNINFKTSAEKIVKHRLNELRK